MDRNFRNPPSIYSEFRSNESTSIACIYTDGLSVHLYVNECVYMHTRRKRTHSIHECTCTQIHASTNAFRISQETDDLLLNADSFQFFRRVSDFRELLADSWIRFESQQPMKGVVTILKWITWIGVERRWRLKSITDPGSLNSSAEGLSLTSVCTLPLLSLSRPQTAHQRAAGFLARAPRATGILVTAGATRNLASLASGQRGRESS